jgi:NADH-quinone oxidoreductase subunit A
MRPRRRTRRREVILMLQNYVPILIFLGVAGALGTVLIGLGFLFGPHRPDEEKLSAYECGFEAFSDSRMKFDVRYYLVAILFIVFDLEIAFLFPWAVSLGTTGMVGMAAMGLFLLILVVGFVYEWKKGALEWD